MTNPAEQDPPELAHWLQEVGRRKQRPARVENFYSPQMPVRRARTWRRYITRPGFVSLLALSAFSFLLYYFMAVRVEILSLPQLVVFVSPEPLPSTS